MHLRKLFDPGINCQTHLVAPGLGMRRRRWFLALLLLALSVDPAWSQRRGRSPRAVQSAAGLVASGFLYSANFASSDISAFTIDRQSGALTAVAASPFSVNGAPVALATDPYGQFLYIATRSNTVAAFAIDPMTGNLSPVIGSPFATGPSPSAIIVDPTGQFVYVTNMGASSISAYAIESETGTLVPVPGSPFGAGSQPVAVGSDPSGEFLYVANQGSNDIFGYAIASTGGLVPLSGSPYPTAGTNPRSVAVDPRGELVYVGNAGSRTVSAFRIGTKGVLTPVGGSPFVVESGAFAVAIDALGQMVYTAPGPDAASSTTPLMIRRNGGLTAVCGSPFFSSQDWGATSVTVHPSGQFVYVTNSASNSIAAYTTNTVTGTLTPLQGSPFPVGTTPLHAAIVPLTTAISDSLPSDSPAALLGRAPLY